MKLFKKKSILLSLLSITVLALASCADKTSDSVLPTPTPKESLVINSKKKVTEDYTAHPMVVNVSSNVDFKYVVKDGDNWITPQSAEKTHAKGDSVKITFNLKENKLGADRKAILLFASANNKNFTDTVRVTQNSFNHLIINSDKKVRENQTAHQMVVNVSSNVDFKYVVKDGSDWITPQSAEKTHAKGDSVKIAFNLKENKLKTDRHAILLFASADNKNFTDTVYVTQNSFNHLIINSKKKVTEDHTAHQITVDVSSNVDFKFAVKDGDDWITPKDGAKTHAKGDHVKIAFNLKENKLGTDRKAKLLFATSDSKDFTDTVYVTQNKLSHLVINTPKKVTENLPAHQMIVDVSSTVDFKFAVKDGGDWIIADNGAKTHAKGDHIKIAFNLKANEPVADRQAKLLFATVDSKDFTDTVYVTQTGIIRVNIPGTLAQEIKNQGLDYLKITKMTVAGTLASADVLCLRKMAGKDEKNNNTNGQLADLDMSRVKFIKDLNPYYIDGRDNYVIDNPTTFPNCMFTYCPSLKSINTPATDVITLGVSSFANCPSLASVNVPGNITSIGDDCFLSCNKLTNINLSDNIEIIGKTAFKACNFITIKLPKNLKVLGEGVFSVCSSLTSIDIPEGVTKIPLSSFRFCSNLTNVNLPPKLTSIGLMAFAVCQSLQSIKLPETVTTISESAFSGCRLLKSINIPEGVSVIQNATFLKCSALAEIKLPERIRSIGNRAFNVCNSLHKVNIPKNVTSIGEEAFKDCTFLQSVTIDVLNPYSPTFTLANNAFDKGTKSILYVPKDKIKDYQNSPFKDYFTADRIRPQQ